MSKSQLVSPSPTTGSSNSTATSGGGSGASSTTGGRGNQAAGAELAGRTEGTTPAACQSLGGGSWAVERGDTLWAIARVTYGQGHLYEHIARANPERVRRGGDLIFVGDVLTLPALQVDPASGDVTEVPPADLQCITHLEEFQAAVAARSLADAQTAFAAMDGAEQVLASTDPSTLVNIGAGFTLADAATLFSDMGLPVLTTLIAHAPRSVLDASTLCDPTLSSLLAADPAQAVVIAGMITGNAARVLFLEGYAVAPQDQLALAGFDLYGAECGTESPDFDLLIRILTTWSQAERQEVLLGMRSQGLWESMIGALGTEHIPLVQSWLGEDQGDGTGQDLDTRIAAATNSARAQTALAACDAAATLDLHGRITPRLRELLALGVALPKLATDPLSSEGVLSVNQVTRATQALMWMPDAEYLRLSMLMELSGDASRLTQSFLMLEAVAARADEFTFADYAFGTEGDLGDLEQFSDDVRDMDQATLVDQTSVVQTSATDATALTQKFTMSCGPTAGQVVRAEADPVEALQMNQGNMLGQNALDNPVAREQEQSLERHGGQTAMPRNRAATQAQVTAALPGSGCTATEQAQILLYMNGNPVTNPAALSTGLVKLEAAGINLESLRMLSGGNSNNIHSGLTPEQMQTEGNGSLDVDGANGQAMGNTRDNALLTSANNNQHTPANMAAWSAQMRTLLTGADARLIAGEDVVFQVRWDPTGGGGGHFMTLTNVRTVGGVKSYLIHDPWNGRTAWITEATILTGNFSAVGLASNGAIWQTN